MTELGKGLSEEGFVEGRNVIIEQRWGDNQPDRLPGLAADLVRRKAAVIVGDTPAVLAAVRVAAKVEGGLPPIWCGFSIIAAASLWALVPKPATRDSCRLSLLFAILL